MAGRVAWLAIGREDKNRTHSRTEFLIMDFSSSIVRDFRGSRWLYDRGSGPRFWEQLQS
jgi:hypothetical protein